MRQGPALCILTAATLMSPLGIADSDSISFSVSQISTREAKEPTLSYAPNGTLWYSGMSIPQANLWFAESDTATFVLEPDSPTQGGVDAVVHHDQDGRMFFAELLISGLTVSTRVDTEWSAVTTIEGGDRPWFRTNGSKVTFLAVFNKGADRVDVWKNKTGSTAWEIFTENVAGSDGLADFHNATDGTLYLLFRQDESYRLAVRAPTDSSWTISSSFTVDLDRSFGAPRLRIDAAGVPYVVYGETVGTSHPLWIRAYIDSSDTWTSAFKIGADGRTAAKGGLAAGASGTLGVAWYEADGNFIPSEAPITKKWDVVYAVIGNASSSPAILEKVTVRVAAHQGAMTGQGGDVGDFMFVERRQGESNGRVALAFACDDGTIAGCVSAISPQPKPFFALQNNGRGLL